MYKHPQFCVLSMAKSLEARRIGEKIPIVHRNLMELSTSVVLAFGYVLMYS